MYVLESDNKTPVRKTSKPRKYRINDGNWIFEFKSLLIFEPYNAPSSGKRERFGAASEWFSDDLVCYTCMRDNSCIDFSFILFN